MQAWKRFSMWMEEGKYIWGERQYLEEHLGFNQEDDHIGGVELYLPVEKAPNMQKVEKREITIEKSRVALFHVEGNDPEKNAQECWGKALEWAKKSTLNHE